jgi:hypothetical protein
VMVSPASSMVSSTTVTILRMIALIAGNPFCWLW